VEEISAPNGQNTAQLLVLGTALAEEVISGRWSVVS
jgi:hypothetical protein